MPSNADALYAHLMVEVVSGSGDTLGTATIVQGSSVPAGGALFIPTTVRVSGTEYTVVAIGTGAFQGNTAITSLTFEADSQVTTIGVEAFNTCTSLTSVTFPASLTAIGTTAFRSCIGLTSISIPDSLTTIGFYAFSLCSGLTSVTFAGGYSVNYDTTAFIFSGENYEDGTTKGIPTFTTTDLDSWGGAYGGAMYFENQTLTQDPLVITDIIPTDTTLTVSFHYYGPSGAVFVYKLNDGTVSSSLPGLNPFTIDSLSPNTSYTVTMFAYYDLIQVASSLPFATKTLPPTVPCFAEGTRILTQHGYKAIETLDAEDRVVTADLRIVPFNLFKTATLAATSKKSAPYLIQRHAFGRNLPAAPIQLSPDHKIQIGAGRWLSAKMAARNNPLVTRCDIGAPVTYYQIECENYFKDNLVAEGLVVESYGTIKATGGKKDIYTWNEELQALTRPADFDRIFANKSA